MSGLAKVFLVINLVLAVVFLGTAATLFSVRMDFKEKMSAMNDEYVQKFQEQKNKLDELDKKGELQALHLSVQYAEIVNAKESNKELTQERDTLQTQVAAATTDNATKQSRIDRLTAQITNLDTQVANLSTRLLQAEEARRGATQVALTSNAEKNTAVIRAVTLDETLAAVNTELTALRDENSLLKTRIAALNRIGRDVGGDPEITAKVVSVKDKLVVLSVGANDGVVKGMQFIVHRNGQYLGDIKVEYVYTDMAGAEVVHLADRGLIREGDDAKTKQQL